MNGRIGCERFDEGIEELALGQVLEPERTELLEAWDRQRAGHEDLWAKFDRLSLRESEVLGLLMQGHSVREIADNGHTAESTVRTQVKAVLAKLEVSSQLAAVVLAYQIGWRAPVDWPLTS